MKKEPWLKEIASPPETFVDAWRRGVTAASMVLAGLAFIYVDAAILGVPLAVAGGVLMIVTFAGASRADKAAGKKAKKKAA